MAIAIPCMHRWYSGVLHACKHNVDHKGDHVCPCGVRDQRQRVGIWDGSRPVPNDE